MITIAALKQQYDQGSEEMRILYKNYMELQKQINTSKDPEELELLKIAWRDTAQKFINLCKSRSQLVEEIVSLRKLVEISDRIN